MNNVSSDSITNGPNDLNNSSNDKSDLEGFCFGNSECLLFSSFDDEKHQMCNFETLDGNSENKSQLPPPENTNIDKSKDMEYNMQLLSQQRK